MPLYKTIAITDGLLGIWQITESPNDLIVGFRTEEVNDPDFRKYTNDKRKAEWLCTRSLIREMIGHNFSISYLSNGKPLLHHPQYQKISISHSRNFVAVIVHRSREAGIDIEETSRDFSRVAQRYLSDRELKNTTGNNGLKCLYWCIKEAIFKLIEEDGIDFKKQIAIFQDAKNPDQYQAEYLANGKGRRLNISYDFIAENCLVWVIE